LILSDAQVCNTLGMMLNVSFKQIGTRCYIARFVKLSWYGADEFCQSLNASLVEIVSEVVQNDVVEFLEHTAYLGIYWTGLHGQTWYWTTGRCDTKLKAVINQIPQVKEWLKIYGWITNQEKIAWHFKNSQLVLNGLLMTAWRTSLTCARNVSDQLIIWIITE
jgi:hypothetical protein